MVAKPGGVDPIFKSALTARPDSIQDLQHLAESVGTSTEAALDALTDAGLARHTGGQVEIIDPAEGLPARVLQRLEEQRAGLDEAIQMLGILPKLVEHWRESGTERFESSAVPPFDVIGSHEDVWAKWWEHSYQVYPKRPGVMTPDSVMLRDQVVRDIEMVKADFIARGFHMRVIISTKELDPESGIDTSYIPILIDAGVEIRAMADPPSWFYVDEGANGQGIGGLPLVWGQGNPAGMLVVRDASILAAMSWMFDSAWARAIPVGAQDVGWEPVLRLLEQGLSDKQVADALGWGLRTVRRRIAEAMDELDAPTRFELGVAWAQRSGA